MADYGYEDAAPDVAAQNMKSLGYEDAAPDVAANNAQEMGYANASPDVASPKKKISAKTELSLDNFKPKKGKKPKQKKGIFHSFQVARENRGRTPRRSSMKQDGKPRRSSIGYRGEIEVMLPGEARPTRRRRSISFDNDEILDIEPVTDINPDKKEMWFQDEEYDVMQQKAHMMSEFVIMGGEEMAKKRNIETRGLEKLYDYEKVEETQQMAYRSVFIEQGFQREEGEFNPEVVSCLYKVASMKSSAGAIARANADEADIEEYTRETRRRIRRSSM
eukprot:CAMPEP_0113643664 /NCGR_PEP_ID=MMETSP0017_2-20120614/22968_1 /TAXON_ID=2856 /ORGANISM="Cylindrotheca closterium" /LENGTH=275 /DNA_ID=CAMNT_0000555209 /DNA_START=85 /DNA_END=912 /DNA_ORIENTATION=+ /assembly_acc=CAM_ASM_000147